MMLMDHEEQDMVNLEPAVLAEVEAICERLDKLPPEAMSLIADRLSPTFPSDPELKAELQRRWDEFVAGRAKTLSHEEVMAGMKKSIASVSR
jgi:putative addiction module component (TIGR02574 family)